MNLPDFPDPQDEVACAEYLIRNKQDVAAFSSWLASSRRTLSIALGPEKSGVIKTSVGEWKWVTDASWEYPAEILDKFPYLGEHAVTFSVDTNDQAERCLEIMSEAAPELETRILKDWQVTPKVNGRLVATFISESKDDEAVRDLKSLRRKKVKMGAAR